MRKYFKNSNVAYHGSHVTHNSSLITHYLSLLLFLTAYCLLPTVSWTQTTEQIEEAIKKQLELERATTARARAVEETIEEEVPAVTEVTVPTGAEEEIPYFGYDFFRSRGNISIWDNIPPPSDYLLGPGDEIVLTLWGETQLRSTHILNRDGNIFIDKVGLVNLAGKSLEGAESFLRSQLERAYATLKNPDPSTFMDVTLGRLKSINVKFVGEVVAPGIYPVHPFSTVVTGLIQVGGINTTGSLRNIQIIRYNEVISEVDMYAFLLKGKLDGDIRLRDQDVVFVPVRESTISITGAIHRPAIYEAIEGEAFGSLLTYAGDIKAQAQTKLDVQRTIPLDQRISDDYAVESFYMHYNKIAENPVYDGDAIVVHPILPVERQITVLGQVKKPGIYAYEDSMWVLNVLNLAGGIDDESYWKSIYALRGEVLRRNIEGDYSVIIPFNLEKLREGDKSQNILLENLDQVIVRQNPYFDPPKNVTVSGEVKIPGVYSILSDYETLEQIINRAGNFTDRAFEEGIRMIRNNTRVVLRDYSIPVSVGDSIYVPEYPGVVTVQGEIYNPGFIHYKKGKSLKEYIESAGGFTLEADKGNISVIYSNGDVKKRKWFIFRFDPTVREGTTVVIHLEEEKEPFDSTEFLKEVASITASLATVFYIVSAASK